MQEQNINTQLTQQEQEQEQAWHPPMEAEPPVRPAHPPELRFQEESRRTTTRNIILSVQHSKLPIYDPIMRELLTDAMLTIDERITTLEERMCFFESSGAILQKPHMNAKEVAIYLGYTRCAIYNLTRRRLIPFHKVGRHIFFDKQEIDDWIRQKKPTKWDELGVTPESIPIDFNENIRLMQERASLEKNKKSKSEDTGNNDNNNHKTNNIDDVQ